MLAQDLISLENSGCIYMLIECEDRTGHAIISALRNVRHFGTVFYDLRGSHAVIAELSLFELP
jgi:hypothetical protein